MKLPNADAVIIEHAKITGYLLDETHSDNRGKALFFQSLGFSKDEWQTFAAALRKLAETAEIRESRESSHGHKYVLDGPIETPSGKMPIVRTIWIIDHGMQVPRLITAYPR